MTRIEENHSFIGLNFACIHQLLEPGQGGRSFGAQGGGQPRQQQAPAYQPDEEPF